MPTAIDPRDDIEDEPPTDVGDDGPTDDGGEGDAETEVPVDVDDGPPVGLSWPRVVVLGAALAFLGFAFALFMGRDRPPGPDSVDVGFMQDMISHHEQAVDMAQTELVDGSDPTVLAFAREILMFQSKEIGSMERLLADWDSGRGDPERQAMTWMGMSTPVDQMPGMATEEELDSLRAAQGTNADALFLELMARHHVGGMHMSEYATDNAGTDAARDFAAVVGRNQAIEVNEYAQTAERLGLPVDIERVDVPAASGA
ncbi:MAG TPA: DUF305 domain-containing protein [Acidimicrobiales bacterium]|nr:DUF305 domain-containing protein [Acidimicrobiales bacterium]